MKNIFFLIAFFLFTTFLGAQIIDSVAVDYNATTEILKVQVRGSIVVLDPNAIKSIVTNVYNDTVVLAVNFKPCSPWQMFPPYDTIYATSIFLPPGPKILKVLSITMANTDTSCYFLEKDSHYDSTYTSFNIPIGLTEEQIGKINIYPNPTHGDLQVEIKTEERVDFEFYTVTGKLMQAGILPESRKLHFEEYQAGVYFLKLKLGKNTIVKKIIKN